MGNKFTLLALVLVACGGIVVVGISRGWFGGDAPINKPNLKNRDSVADISPSKPSEPAKSLAAVLKIDEGDLKPTGGIVRPVRDTDFSAHSEAKPVSKSALPVSLVPKSISSDANQYVKNLVDDLQDETTRRSAISPYAAAEEFDLEQYQADPQAYLSQIRPGRIYQASTDTSAQPLIAKSAQFQTVVSGTKVLLRAQGTQGMPLTFHCNDGAVFTESGLQTISLAFDQNGLATATLETANISRGLIQVLSASPVHFGQLKYTVRVVSTN